MEMTPKISPNDYFPTTLTCCSHPNQLNKLTHETLSTQNQLKETLEN